MGASLSRIMLDRWEEVFEILWESQSKCKILYGGSEQFSPPFHLLTHSFTLYPLLDPRQK